MTNEKWTVINGPEDLPKVDLTKGNAETVIATIETRLLGLTVHVNAVTFWKHFDDVDGSFDLGSSSTVIAWMPLPKPYRRKRKE